MIEYVKLEPGERFVMPENYSWYKEKHFMTFIPEPKTFEELENRLHFYYDMPENISFKVYYYNYYIFAVLHKNGKVK